MGATRKRSSACAILPVRDHDRCADELRDRMARNGCLIQIATDRAELTGPYICRPYTCTHGTTYWVTPTEEQATLWQARKERSR